MAERPPWLDYQAPQGVTVPLGTDPYKRAAEQRANRADARAEAAAVREQKKFEKEDTVGQAPGDPTKTGEAYLETLPGGAHGGLANRLRAMSDGRLNYPTGSAAMRSPAVQQMMDALAVYDPSVDFSDPQSRVKTRVSFTSGDAMKSIRSLNMALGHLGSWYQNATKLHNRGLPAWNALANATLSNTGHPLLEGIEADRQALSDELPKVFSGTAGALQDREYWMHQLGTSKSPEQFREKAGELIKLMVSRVNTLQQSYQTGMGRSRDMMDFLNPHAKAVFNALGPDGDGNVPDLPKDFGGNPPILGGPSAPAQPPGALPSDGGQGGNDPNGGAPQKTAASGATRTTYDARTSAQIDAMINAGASKSMIDAVMKRQNFPAVTPGEWRDIQGWRKANPGKAYFGANISRQEALNPWQQFAGSAAGAGIAHAADMATAGIVPALAGEKARGALDAMSALHPDASTVGDVVGGVAGAGGLEAGVARAAPAALAKYAPRIADTLYGGLTGFNQAPEGQGLGNAALGAGAGLAGGIIGTKLTSGLGRVTRGVVDPAVQRLRALDIPLTAGEVLGGGYKKAQDALTSVFGPGDMVARRYAEGRRALNEAGFNQGGAVIDTPINATGQRGIELLDAAKGKAYSDSLDPISLNLNDPKFIDSMQAAMDAANKIPGAELPEGYGGVSIRHYVGNQVAPDGTMTGRGFQQAYRGLAQTASKAAPKIEGYDIGQAVGQAKDALTTALQEQNPDAFEGFLRANSANRHLSILRDAVGAAKNQDDQLFTPAQLNTAAFGNTAKYSGKTAAAMGDGPFQQLATDAQQVMSSKLPDSGTAKRVAMLALATGGSAGGGYGLDGGQGAAEGGLGTMLLLAAGGSRPAQHILTNMLTERPAAARKIGDFLVTNAPYGSAFGAGTLPLAVGR